MIGETLVMRENSGGFGLKREAQALPQTRSAPGRGRGLIGANAYKKGELQK